MKIFTYETEPGLIHKDYALILKQHLHATAPGYQIEIASASSKLAQLIDECSNEAVFIKNLAAQFGGDGYRILISCHAGAKFHKWGLESDPDYEWGYWRGTYSIDYAPNDCRLANQIHESLHLFGVNDCYCECCKQTLPSCDNPSCVMRNGNDKTEICTSVFDQLKRKLI